MVLLPLNSKSKGIQTVQEGKRNPKPGSEHMCRYERHCSGGVVMGGNVWCSNRMEAASWCRSVHLLPDLTQSQQILRMTKTISSMHFHYQKSLSFQCQSFAENHVSPCPSFDKSYSV